MNNKNCYHCLIPWSEEDSRTDIIKWCRAFTRGVHYWVDQDKTRPYNEVYCNNCYGMIGRDCHTITVASCYVK